MTNYAERLIQIEADIRTCVRCPLFKEATNAVPGEGPAYADLMIIGEGPGLKEDKLGRPFVGASGRFLDELLGSISLKRSDIFITNVVKHRPPNNRDPLPQEIEACRPWLDKQIELIRPRVVVTISRFAMARWFPNEKISAIHGLCRGFGDLLVVPMYHPAAALYNPNLRPVLHADFNKLPQYIQMASTAAKVVGKSKNDTCSMYRVKEPTGE